MGPWSLQIDDKRLTFCDMFTAETFEIYVVNIDAGLLTSIRVSFFRFHVFILSWNLFMSMLGSQAGPPILTNPDVHSERNIN